MDPDDRYGRKQASYDATFPQLNRLFPALAWHSVGVQGAHHLAGWAVVQRAWMMGIVNMGTYVRPHLFVSIWPGYGAISLPNEVSSILDTLDSAEYWIILVGPDIVTYAKHGQPP
jgi:hypothetical protein